MLADDICAFDASNPAEPVIWPSFAEFNLWPDSLEALAPILPASPPGPGGCQSVDASQWFQPEPVRPGAILTLQSALSERTQDCIRLTGLKAFEKIMNAMLMADLTSVPFYGQSRVAPAACLSNLSAVFELWHPFGLSHVSQQADRVLEALARPLQAS